MDPTPKGSQSDKPPQDRYHHGNLRAALLAAAEAELEEKGMEGFSLRGIAKRAGVSHAAPAHHFRDTNALLTALAAEGFRRFLAVQTRHQAEAAQDPLSQLVAAGMGYIDFAMLYPALFQLMFVSERPDHDASELAECAGAALDHLSENISRLRQPDAGAQDALMLDVMSVWALAHGLADLMRTGRLKHLDGLPQAERISALEQILRRSYA